VSLHPSPRPPREIGHAGSVWPWIDLVLAGHLAFFGSFMTWDICPDSSCNRPGVGGLMAIWPTSGVEFGPGIVTAILGAVLVAVGLVGLRRSSRLVGLASVVSGGLIVVTCIAFFVRLHVFPEGRYYGPDMGLVAVLVSGVIAIGAGRRIVDHAPAEQSMASSGAPTVALSASDATGEEGHGALQTIGSFDGTAFVGHDSVVRRGEPPVEPNPLPPLAPEFE
jgi:hypothetical protein